MTYPIMGNGRMVTLVHKIVTGKDDYGNDVYERTEDQVGPCSIQPQASQETTNFSDQATTSIIVFMPYGTDVGYIDAVIVDGFEYEVTGDPDIWASPFSGNTCPVRVSGRLVKGASS